MTEAIRHDDTEAGDLEHLRNLVVEDSMWFARARDAWTLAVVPDGTVDRMVQCVVSMISRRLAETGERPERAVVTEILARIAAADLLLASACDLGSQEAWRLLIDGHRVRLQRFAESRGLGRADAHELVEQVLDDLSSPSVSGAGTTRLGDYGGRSSLFGWLSTIVGRRIIDRSRQARPAASLDDEKFRARPEDSRPGGVSAMLDPAKAMENDEACDRIVAAFATAWRLLSDREALVLKARFQDDQPLAAIADLLGVGVPRVSRIVTAAIERLREALRGALPGGALHGEVFWRAVGNAISPLLANSAWSSDHRRGSTQDHDQR